MILAEQAVLHLKIVPSEKYGFILLLDCQPKYINCSTALEIFDSLYYKHFNIRTKNDYVCQMLP